MQDQASATSQQTPLGYAVPCARANPSSLFADKTATIKMGPVYTWGGRTPALVPLYSVTMLIVLCRDRPAPLLIPAIFVPACVGCCLLILKITLLAP